MKIVCSVHVEISTFLAAWIRLSEAKTSACSSSPSAAKLDETTASPQSTNNHGKGLKTSTDRRLSHDQKLRNEIELFTLSEKKKQTKNICDDDEYQNQNQTHTSSDSTSDWLMAHAFFRWPIRLRNKRKTKAIVCLLSTVIRKRLYTRTSSVSGLHWWKKWAELPDSGVSNNHSLLWESIPVLLQ